MLNDYEIEIIVGDHVYLESMTQSWKSYDLIFTCEYDHLEQIIFSAYSPHIEKLKTKKDLNRRLVSLNILVNGALFVSSAKTIPRISFNNYHVENRSLDIETNGMSLWSDVIDEYPFEHSEEHYKQSPNIKLPADLDSVLFSIAKLDFIIRTLLFQAGVIFNNSVTDKILTWNTLYKMVDTIRHGCKEIDKNIEDLIESKDLERFTSACNNPTVLGVYARHGGSAKEPKRIQPITNLDEAIELILCLANRFAKIYIMAKGYVSIAQMDISKCKHKVYEDPWQSVEYDLAGLKDI